MTREGGITGNGDEAVHVADNGRETRGGNNRYGVPRREPTPGQGETVTRRYHYNETT